MYYTALAESNNTTLIAQKTLFQVFLFVCLFPFLFYTIYRTKVVSMRRAQKETKNEEIKGGVPASALH